MKKLVFALVLASLLFSACEKSNSEDEVKILVPLAVGNIWEYTDSVFTKTGELINVIDRKWRVNDMSEVEFEGEILELYHLNHYYFSDFKGWYDYSWLYCMDNEGYHCYGGVTEDGQLHLLGKSTVAKYPADLNETWERESIAAATYADPPFYFNGTIRNYTCESIDTLISTPAGDYACYMYSYTSTSGDDEYKTSIYYSLNIGRVALYQFANGSNMTFKSVLSDYTLVD